MQVLVDSEGRVSGVRVEVTQLADDPQGGGKVAVATGVLVLECLNHLLIALAVRIQMRTSSTLYSQTHSPNFTQTQMYTQAAQKSSLRN